MGNSFEESPLFQLLSLEAGQSQAFQPSSLPADLQSKVYAPQNSPHPHYWGHRERLRKRFREAGGEALPDYEIMELVLFRAIPRRDVKPLAKEIIAHFGSFAEAAAAKPERLLKIDGVTEAVVTELKLIHTAALRIGQGEIRKRPVLASWSAVLEYLRSAMAFEGQEQFRILYLDRRNKLILDEVSSRGTVDHTPVYIREIIKRALEVSATAIILAHNHPSGDPTPSKADVTMTAEVIKAAKVLGIQVHDHVIVGRDGHLSMKAAGLFEPEAPLYVAEMSDPDQS